MVADGEDAAENDAKSSDIIDNSDSAFSDPKGADASPSISRCTMDNEGKLEELSHDTPTQNHHQDECEHRSLIKEKISNGRSSDLINASSNSASAKNEDSMTKLPVSKLGSPNSASTTTIANSINITDSDAMVKHDFNGGSHNNMACPTTKCTKNAAASKTTTCNNIFPYHIGGPNTTLPIVVESFLGWSLCLSCLAVSGYHYGKSIISSSNWYLKCHRRVHVIIQKIRMRQLIGKGILFQYNNEAKQILDNHCNTQTNKVVQLLSGNQIDNDENDEVETPWIPLTTHSRAELDRKSPWERYVSLVCVLEKNYPESLLPTHANGQRKNAAKDGNVEEIANAALIHALRTDDICRRLASLAMRPFDVTITTTTTFTTASTVSASVPFGVGRANILRSCASHDTIAPVKTTTDYTTTKAAMTTLLKQHPNNSLLQRLYRLWRYFLILPSLEESKKMPKMPVVERDAIESNDGKSETSHCPFRISVILPAFREHGSHLATKLNNALQMAHKPEEVEVIVVDAGECKDLDMLLSSNNQSSTKNWGNTIIAPFHSGGGRGPCLNFGAATASGRILTFCHSDTALPYHWDTSIVSTLEHGDSDNLPTSILGAARANSCAFSFGIDQSREGLSMPFTSSCSKLYYPPGIRAVETTANMRTHLYSLPYGDQVLSLHACVFRFLGGFPDQCLMEDYELVSLLRRRAALFVFHPQNEVHLNHFSEKAETHVSKLSSMREKLSIVPGPPALCSPRRWQKFGVLYVTFMNSRFVNLYAGARKLSPDELFRLYYGNDPPKRDEDESPWEVTLHKTIQC